MNPAIYTQTDKCCGLTSLIAHVRPGDCVVIGGGLSSREPMAALRELVRQAIGNLKLAGSAHGIDVDLLCGAGLVAESAESYVGFEQDFGMAPNYRRACEAGTVAVRDSCCYTLVQQLRAAIAGLPFMPMRSVRGTGFMAMHPEYKTMICPYTGEELLLVPALKPDVAIIHAQYGDAHGNLHIEGPPVADILFAKASKKVIATVEQILPTGQLAEKGVTIPYFYIAALSEVPYGAHPTACYPFYAYDRRHTAEYYRLASESAEAFNGYLQTYVCGCESQTGYLEAIGGVKTLGRLASWRQGVEAWQALYA
ncbi:MAG: acyl CoA--acetate/3-ketoacid CoA transferase subunit alpha [Candidatus Methylumidiphilus alinenensis]|uniref:Acyl CoA--acetate/3-ketoacid CoA transferase subunit alpha n=1 Tax=Candidatus Methylumidiphilus alinenensis TaxID=2202197 RepID=A0A2W4SBJ6_9GAMM|nr:MAG: acyl CoA--acetate/3-ketoacid CoA transferase subunit alpha [Candidatus Methylumidiphilus alinenensis]